MTRFRVCPPPKPEPNEVVAGVAVTRIIGAHRNIFWVIHLKDEGARLDLMSELLDPMHRRYIDALDVVKPGARTLEVWMRQRIDFCLARRTTEPQRNSGSY